MAKRRPCKACGGKGLFAPAHPSCKIPGLRHPWIVIERCDICEFFPDDLLAAQSVYAVAGWFTCTGGAFHALADSRTYLEKQIIRNLPPSATPHYQNATSQKTQGKGPWAMMTSQGIAVVI